MTLPAGVVAGPGDCVTTNVLINGAVVHAGVFETRADAVGAALQCHAYVEGVQLDASDDAGSTATAAAVASDVGEGRGGCG